MNLKVRRKDGVLQNFNGGKIRKAIQKSADRVNFVLSKADKDLIVRICIDQIRDSESKKIDVIDLHKMVELALDDNFPKVAKSYREYRNYKMDRLKTDDMIDSQIEYILSGKNKENSNSNAEYISTQKVEIAQTYCKEYFQKMFLSPEEIVAITKGYIYIHDLKDLMLPMYNCCLARIGVILEGGYELDGFYYPEPKNIKNAIGRASDLILNIAAQQYGK